MTPKKDTTKPAVGKAVGQINADTGKVNEAVQPQPPAPAPAPAAQAQVAQPSKQDVTLVKLKEAWEKRGVDVKAMKVAQDGKNMNVIIGPERPLIVIGPGGGITLPAVKSYPRAFDAAVNGDVVLKKQNTRTEKKVAEATPKPQTVSAQPVAPEKKAASPTAKKAAQHKQIEQQIQQA